MTEKQKDVLKILNDNKCRAALLGADEPVADVQREYFYNKDNRSDYVYQRCLSIPCSTNITG